MILSIHLDKWSNYLTVKRVSNKVINSGWNPINGDEHQLYHWIKVRLNGIGFNLMKVVMEKDKKFSHMYGHEYLPYLRAKDSKANHPHIYIYDGDYAIRSAAEDYNNGEEVTFIIEGSIWEPKVCQDNWQDLVRELIAQGDPSFRIYEH